MRTALSRALSITALAALGTLLLAGCGAPDGDIGELSLELSPSNAISRAEEWVQARLQYCQAANHQRDYDDACTTYCDRTDNSAWNPYRSDCSGLISWAWGLAAPGRTTWMFAPFETDISSVISASSLRPADAVNNSDHVMLFKNWITPGSRATFIEEPGCATAITHAHEFDSDVSVSGSSIYVSYIGATFTAIRYRGFGSGGGGGGGGGGSGAGNCVPGGLYCGGDKVSGDSHTLYRCNSSGAPTVVERCSGSCAVMAGRDDACAGGTSGGDCTVGGLYCGGDKVVGEANTLYRCGAGGDPQVVSRCASGCQVNPGRDDSCRASGGSCVAGGLYCGGDKVSGDSSTLYRCNGSSAPTVIARCAAGCSVNAGTNDSCRAGGSCVAGGLYCGGDKVNGDPRTLYRCTGGSSGTVVSHCASGCLVRPGMNDACK